MTKYKYIWLINYDEYVGKNQIDIFLELTSPKQKRNINWSLIFGGVFGTRFIFTCGYTGTY